MTIFKRFGIGVLLFVTCLAATLAVPVRSWRSGRMPQPPLRYTTGEPPPAPRRVWVDTDAACGYTPRTDVDDCLALWLLSGTRDVEIVGVSTVFGNAPLDVTDRTTRELVDRLDTQFRDTRTPVYRGAAQRSAQRASPVTPAHDALIRALVAGPLTIVALGPLTNIAGALSARRDLEKNVGRIVAAMGQRAGHLFHPSEGSGRGTLLGHGPVFRDFNFSADPKAAQTVISMKLPATLVPYDAARGIEIGPDDLQQLAEQGEAGAWIARRAEAWLEYWRTDVGRSGFYPFDLMAAAYIAAPRFFVCADVHAWVGADPLLFVPLFRPQALLVGQSDAQPSEGRALYCPSVHASLKAELRGRFTRAAGANGQ